MIKLATTKAIPAPKKHQRLMLSASITLTALLTSLAVAASSFALFFLKNRTFIPR
jgi:hypothetical protein